MIHNYFIVLKVVLNTITPLQDIYVFFNLTGKSFILVLNVSQTDQIKKNRFYFINKIIKTYFCYQCFYFIMIFTSHVEW